MSILGPRSPLFWIACCCVGLFLAPAFLTSAFGADGPFGRLTALAEAPKCRYTQHFVATRYYSDFNYTAEAGSANVAVGAARRPTDAAIPDTRYAPILTLVSRIDADPVPPNVYSSVWPALADVVFDAARAAQTAYLEFHDFRRELLVADGTPIQYASTAETSTPPAQLHVSGPTIQYFNDPGVDVAAGVYFSPQTPLAFSSIHADVDPVYNTSHQITIAYIDDDGTRVPIAQAPGDEARLRQLLTDNGRNPDACDVSDGAQAQVRNSALDDEYGIVALDIERTSLSDSMFRPVIAAAIALVPLFVVISVLAFWLPRLRRTD